jgi:hydrogenase maturation factor
MVAVVPDGSVETRLDTIRASGHDAWAIGEVVDGHGRVAVRR